MTEHITALKGTVPPSLPRSSPTPRGDFLMPDHAERDGFVFTELEKFIHAQLLTLRIPDLQQKAENFIVVAGKPGTGKTHAIRESVLRAKWAIREVPPSSLASEHESGAVTPLKQALEDAVDFSHAHQVPVALVLNDIELSILPTANTGKIGTTVNTPLLNGFIQQLTDAPRQYCGVDGTPILLVCSTNDLTGLRSSLLRSARAEIYEHAPTYDERFAFAEAMLRPRNLRERKRVGWLMRLFSDQPVSFWVALATQIKKGKLYELIDRGITNPEEAARELGRPIPLEFRRTLTIARRISANRNRSYL